MAENLNLKMSEIIAQGAEAVLIKQGNQLIKRRIRKNYRHIFLDSFLRTSRTRREAKLLLKASTVVSVPIVSKADDKKAEIVMDFINGKLLSKYLDSFSKSKALKICGKIGQEIALLHDSDIIHGDLTTSNMILAENNIKKINNNQENKISMTDNVNDRIRLKKELNVNDVIKENFQIVFIDFGLGFISARDEDKAVDLHLLHEALTSKHFLRAKAYLKAVFEGYKSSKKAEDVIVKLKKVESRGRYKGKAGRWAG